ETCKRIFSGRGCPPEKISVIMNSPDESIFQCREPSTPCTKDIMRPWVIMYHGTLVERHGVDLAVAAIEKVRSSIPRVELRIYGRCTPFLEQVMDLVQKSELPEVVRYLGPKKLEVVAEAIRECDIGIIPNRRSIFTELNTPTRILEYLSQGKPVIAPRAPGILEYFGPEDLVFFELGDVNDLAVKIEYAFSHPEEMARMVKRAQKVYSAHKWSCERQQLVSLVERLLNITERPHFNRMFGFHSRKAK
ncbi:MAG TPA: glycosyltransferase, partial [Chthoniobacterales bacterium]|nr:glycosyltransferase [Chthoniobacterales bacterium]